MINIEGRIYIEIKIDGKPLDGANLVSSLALLEGTACTAPSLMMILNDNSQTLTKELCLTDGNEILITVGKTPNDLKTITRQYRLFSVMQMAGQAGPRLQVLGIYDAPKYTTESARDSYEGTSSAVLKQLAEKCKLDYDGPEDFNGRGTVDNQVWLSVSKNRGAFVQQNVAPYAYVDEFSAMYAALTSLGVLKFRNLLDVVATPMEEIKYVFLHNIGEGDTDSSKQVYRVDQSKERSDAGLMNSMANYGSTQIVDGPSGITQVEDKVDVKTSAPYLAINDQVAQTVGRAKISYGPIDCGNVHDKYYRAEYQNKRQLALFSERVSILISEPTEVQLFDPVLYKQANADPARPVRNSDIYIVVAKTIIVVGGQHYGERIELVRMSITEKGAAELKSSEPTSARESSIPDTLVDPSATIAANTIGRAKGIMGIVGGIEGQLNAVRAKAENVLNNAKLTLPSLTNFTSNMGTYLQNPEKALKDLQSGAASLKQLKSTLDDYRTDLKTATDAIRSGNVELMASGINGISRTAAMFRPTGVAENVSAMLGITQVMKSTSEMYASVGAQFQAIRGPLDAAVGAGKQIDEMVGDITGIVQGYQSQASSMASSYNSLIQTVTGETPNLSVPNLELNRFYFEDSVRQSVTPVATPINEISRQTPTVSDVQSRMADTLQVKDDSRNYQWAPESGYTVARVGADQLKSKLAEMVSYIDTSGRQNEEYNYTRSA